MEPSKYRIWWIPNLPGEAFKVEVESIELGRFLLNALVDYTRYLDHRGLMPETISEVGGIELWEIDITLPDGGEWVSVDLEERDWTYEPVAEDARVNS